jgi:hypothetical protein
MTRVAMVSTDGGMRTPSTRAVRMLMTKSNLEATFAHIAARLLHQRSVGADRCLRSPDRSRVHDVSSRLPGSSNQYRQRQRSLLLGDDRSLTRQAPEFVWSGSGSRLAEATPAGFGSGAIKTAVPEPETWALMAIGTGFVGCMSPRQRRAAAT